MNEWSALSLAVIAQAVEDLHDRREKHSALSFLMDEDELFFFIDLGEISLKTGEMRREMHDPRKARKWVRDLKRMRQAAL